MSDSQTRVIDIVKTLDDKRCKALAILLTTSTLGVATATADAKAGSTAAPARPTRRAASAPAPAAPTRARRAAAEPVAEELDADTVEGDDVTLPENPTVDDLFDFIENVLVEPKTRKLMQTREDVEAFGGDFKAIQATAETDAIGDRRDACEEFVARSEALYNALLELDAKSELQPLIGELDITVADIKEAYGDATKPSVAMAIVCALNEDEDDAAEEPAPEPAPAPATRPARRAANAAPAAAAPARARRAAPAPVAPARPARRAAIRDAAPADDLGDELEDL